MTEQNSFACKMCGNPKIVTRLPIMIQIKFKTDKRKRSSLCRNDGCYPSGKIKMRWGVSDSTKSSDSIADSAKDMRSNNHRRHSDKWNIFDRVPFRRRNTFNENLKKIRTSSQFSSNESVCRCDEELLIDDKSVEREHFRRSDRNKKHHEFPSSTHFKKSPNKYSPLKNHSHSESNATFSIHSTPEESLTISKPAKKSNKKPVDRIKQPYEVTEKNTQKYKKTISVSTIFTGNRHIANEIKPLKNDVKRSEDGFCELNYRLIIDVLNGLNANEKIEILEGIRWRLTNSSGNEREKTIRDISQYDLLGVRYQNCAETRLEQLLWPSDESTNDLLQKCAAKFLFAIVSMKTGRAYIKNISLIRLLAWQNNNNSSQTCHFVLRPLVHLQTAEFLVGILMKLCTIPYHKEAMINDEIIDWAISHLIDIEYSASVPHFKYVTKLITELLPIQSPVFVPKESSQLIILLICLAENKELSACKMVFLKALSVLLKQPRILKIARELNVENVLWKLIQSTQNVTERNILENILQTITLPANSKIKTTSSQPPQDAENGIDLDILKDNSVVNREKFFEAKYSQKKSPLKNMFTDFTNAHVPKKSSKSYSDLFSREKQMITQNSSKRYFDRRFLSLSSTAKKCDDNQNVANEKSKSNLEDVHQDMPFDNPAFNDMTPIPSILVENVDRQNDTITKLNAAQTEMTNASECTIKREQFKHAVDTSGSFDSDVIVRLFENSSDDDDNHRMNKIEEVIESIPELAENANIIIDEGTRHSVQAVSELTEPVNSNHSPDQIRENGPLLENPVDPVDPVDAASLVEMEQSGETRLV